MGFSYIIQNSSVSLGDIYAVESSSIYPINYTEVSSDPNWNSSWMTQLG